MMFLIVLVNELGEVSTRFEIQQRHVFTAMGFLTTVVYSLLRLHLDYIMPSIARPSITLTALHDPDSCPYNFRSHNLTEILPTNETVNPNVFDWNQRTIDGILISFSTGYAWTQWAGGYFADLFGGKLVLSISIVWGSLMTIAVPVVAKNLDPMGLNNLRMVTGVALGPVLPALMSMMSKWIPTENHTFVGSVIFPGVFVGQIIAIYLSDLIVKTAGWEVVCYVCGVLGLVWFLLWKYICYSTPNKHPFISKDEKKYLNESVNSLKRTLRNDLDPVPWVPHFFSAPVWGVTVGYIGKEWALSLLTAHISQLIRDVFGNDIGNSLALSSLPYLCIWISALVFGYICDFIILKEFVSRKKARQLFTAISLIGSGICIILSAYTNCSVMLSIFWICLGMSALGASYSGVFIGALDLSPNYVGNVMGIIDNIGTTVVLLTSAFSALIVTEALLSQWKLYLWLMVMIMLITLAVYLYHVEGDQLWWDDVRKLGYPDSWKRGLLLAKGIIDKNGQTISVEPKDPEKSI